MRQFFRSLFLSHDGSHYVPQLLERAAMLGMLAMVLVSFLAANLQALLWQSSEWLVSTVLPAVVVDLTNEERGAAAAPLVRSALLDDAAQRKAEHMAKQGYFSHYSPDGVSPWYWFEQVGYTYAHAGENLAIHFSDSGAVVDAWMRSPTHRANIMSRLYTEIGVGTAKGLYDGYETVFVVQLFGTPAAPRSVPAKVSAPEPVATPTVPSSTPLTVELAMATDTAELVAVAGEATGTILVSETEEVPETDILPVPPAENQPVVVDAVTVADTHVSMYSDMVATSSGLAAMIQIPHDASGTTKAAFAARLVTQPSFLLQFVYSVLGSVVVGMLLVALALAVRAHRPWHVVRSAGLLLLMGCLVAVHLYLTAGAVVA